VSSVFWTCLLCGCAAAFLIGRFAFGALEGLRLTGVFMVAAMCGTLIALLMEWNR